MSATHARPVAAIPAAGAAEGRGGASHPAAAYEPPTVQVLGTLAALTLGGDAAGVPDGFGQSGDAGFTGSI